MYCAIENNNHFRNQQIIVEGWSHQQSLKESSKWANQIGSLLLGVRWCSLCGNKSGRSQADGSESLQSYQILIVDNHAIIFLLWNQVNRGLSTSLHSEYPCCDY